MLLKFTVFWGNFIKNKDISYTFKLIMVELLSFVLALLFIQFLLLCHINVVSYLF